ncbi:MAG: transposase [Gammaproteobacteria bacterium]|nr:transposase [Gammaproteobacteria bacterium]
MANGLHGCNLRKGRCSLPGQVYLVTAVTHRRQPFFSDFVLGRLVVREFIRAEIFYQADTLAFVVMPDHFHWLLSLGSIHSLSAVVGNVKSHSARTINTALDRDGKPVWQRSFHDHAVRSEESMIDVARYIISNPLRAGLVRKVGDYPLWDAMWL